MELTFWLNKYETIPTLRHYGEGTLNTARLRAAKEVSSSAKIEFRVDGRVAQVIPMSCFGQDTL